MLGRWGTPDEAAGDGALLTDLVSLSAAAAWLTGGPLDRRLLRLLQGLHLQVCRSPQVEKIVLLRRSCLPCDEASCDQVPSAALSFVYKIPHGRAGAVAEHLRRRDCSAGQPAVPPAAPRSHFPAAQRLSPGRLIS